MYSFLLKRRKTLNSFVNVRKLCKTKQKIISCTTAGATAAAAAAATSTVVTTATSTTCATTSATATVTTTTSTAAATVTTTIFYFCHCITLASDIYNPLTDIRTDPHVSDSFRADRRVLKHAADKLKNCQETK